MKYLFSSKWTFHNIEYRISTNCQPQNADSGNQDDTGDKTNYHNRFGSFTDIEQNSTATPQDSPEYSQCKNKTATNKSHKLPTFVKELQCAEQLGIVEENSGDYACDYYKNRNDKTEDNDSGKNTYHAGNTVPKDTEDSTEAILPLFFIQRRRCSPRLAYYSFAKGAYIDRFAKHLKLLSRSAGLGDYHPRDEIDQSTWHEICEYRQSRIKNSHYIGIPPKIYSKSAEYTAEYVVLAAAIEFFAVGGDGE